MQKRAQPDMETHINILAWLLIGSAILTGVGGMIILFTGQFIRRLPFMVAPEMTVGTDRLIGAGHFVGGLISLVALATLALAAGVAAAGVGLLQYRSWARVFTIVMAVFLLFHFPIGTIVAIYAFWVLFSPEGQQYYKTHSTVQ